MRAPLDRMIISLRESLVLMSETLDHLLVAAYVSDQTDRSEVVARLQREIDGQVAAMQSLVIDVLATQQPVLATDLSVVKGLLVASRQLGHIAREQQNLAFLMDQVGIVDPQLPAEVTVVLPEVRQVVTESIAAFLHDDRLLAEFTFERVGRLERALQTVPMPPHPPTLVPVQQLHLSALQRILASANEIAHSAPLYRYVSTPG